MTLHAKDGNTQFTLECFCFFKLFIFICGFSARVTCAFFKKQRRKSQESEKRGYLLFWIRLRFQGYCFQSGIVIFAGRRVTWNYAYSPATVRSIDCSGSNIFSDGWVSAAPHLCRLHRLSSTVDGNAECGHT